jgi:hypothetical protein
MGYCPRCHCGNGYLADDSKLCRSCKKSENQGDELTRKTNALLNSYALNHQNSTLIKSLQSDRERLQKENKDLNKKLKAI